MRVKVYRNLKHGRKAAPLYSVVDLATGRVVAREHNVVLAWATFKVSEAGRQRVLRDGVKNVHAYVVGTWAKGAGLLKLAKRGSYNPFHGPSFTCEGQPVESAYLVQLGADGLTMGGVNGRRD